MDTMWSRDAVWHAALVSRVVVPVTRLMMSIGEDGQRTIRVVRRETRLADSVWMASRDGLAEEADFRHGVEVVLLLDGTIAALAVRAAADVLIDCTDQVSQPSTPASHRRSLLLTLLALWTAILRVTLLGALALDVRGSRFAEAATVRALGHRPALFVDMCQRSLVMLWR